jgi:hypothetical protein
MCFARAQSQRFGPQKTVTEKSRYFACSVGLIDWPRRVGFLLRATPTREKRGVVRTELRSVATQVDSIREIIFSKRFFGWEAVPEKFRIAGNLYPLVS